MYHITMQMYDQMTNKTSLTIYAESPYTVITRLLDGNLLDLTDEEKINKVLTKLSQEINPNQAIEAVNESISDVVEEVKRVSAKGNNLKQILDVAIGDETRIDEIEKVKKDTKEALEGKSFKNLSTPQKDRLLESLAKMLGLIE